jgi:nucleoside-diphosphate-sugar epimerase
MKVLVAGGTGVIGQQLIPLLLDEGYDVVALARSDNRASNIPVATVVADALNSGSVSTAVRSVAPDAVINLLTAIPQRLRPRRFASDMASTNRLRNEGTRALIAAAPNAQVITQSVAFLYRPAPGLAAEHRELWTDGPTALRAVIHALRTAELLTLDAGGAVLRFGHLYGPQTHFSRDGAFTTQVRAGRMPLVNGSSSVFSFTHTTDAARAVVAALGKKAMGTYNIVDDEPVPIDVWLPEFASLLGAPEPKHVPGWLATIMGGSWGRAYLTSLVGADNRRASEELLWRPSWPSWSEGFRALMGEREDT